MKEQRVQERTRAHSCDGRSRDYVQQEREQRDFFAERLGCLVMIGFAVIEFIVLVIVVCVCSEFFREID